MGQGTPELRLEIPRQRPPEAPQGEGRDLRVEPRVEARQQDPRGRVDVGAHAQARLAEQVHLRGVATEGGHRRDLELAGRLPRRLDVFVPRLGAPAHGVEVHGVHRRVARQGAQAGTVARLVDGRPMPVGGRRRRGIDGPQAAQGGQHVLLVERRAAGGEGEARRIGQGAPDVRRRAAPAELRRARPVGRTLEGVVRPEEREESRPLALVGPDELHPVTQAPGPQQGRVQVRGVAVGGPDDERAGGGDEPVERGEEGEQNRVVALPEGEEAREGEAIDLVDVGHAARVALGQVAQHAPHALRREFVGRHLVEGDGGTELRGEVACHERLAEPGRAVEEEPAWKLGVEQGRPLGLAQQGQDARHLAHHVADAHDARTVDGGELDAVGVEPGGAVVLDHGRVSRRCVGHAPVRDSSTRQSVQPVAWLAWLVWRLAGLAARGGRAGSWTGRSRRPRSPHAGSLAEH